MAGPAVSNATNATLQDLSRRASLGGNQGMSKSAPLIAVVGAGISGTACAAALHKAGLQTRIFDKSSGAGGRMSTRLGDGWQCDHGAPYFVASHPDFKAEVARWRQAGAAGVWASRIQVLGERRVFDTDSAHEKFVGIPRMTAPAQLVCKDIALTARTTIQQIDRRTDGWYLYSPEQGWLDTGFYAVMLALPAPQAMALLKQPAPALAAVANTAAMRGCWAMMLRFATALDLPFDAALINEGPLRWLARDNSKPGRSGPETWVIHASAEWSEAHLERDSDWVAAALLQAVGRLGAPQPLAWTAHRWRYADTKRPLNRGCLWESASNLGVCGDWLMDGTVQGAWLSGIQLAQHMLHSHIGQTYV
jgi:predicted NAD/FAD-dependent oxidoreductase